MTRSVATKQSQILRQRDCFAALAMTQVAARGPGARSPPPAGIQGKISSQLLRCEENEEEGRISRSVFGHRMQGVWPACALGGEWPVSSRQEKASCPLRTHHALLQ